MAGSKGLPNFKVWCPDDGDEPEYATQWGYDAEHAAEMWAESRWADLDYPEEFSVSTRDEGGVLRKFSIETEQTVNFSATEVEEDDHD